MESRANQTTPGWKSSRKTSPASGHTGSSSTFPYEVPYLVPYRSHTDTQPHHPTFPNSYRPVAHRQLAYMLAGSQRCSTAAIGSSKWRAWTKADAPRGSSTASTAELRTFHCDRVRKMLLSRLDPGMLISFLCKNEEDWINLRQRVTEVCALFFIHIPGLRLDGGVGYSSIVR